MHVFFDQLNCLNDRIISLSEKLFFGVHQHIFAIVTSLLRKDRSFIARVQRSILQYRPPGLRPNPRADPFPKTRLQLLRIFRRLESVFGIWLMSVHKVFDFGTDWLVVVFPVEKVQRPQALFLLDFCLLLAFYGTVRFGVMCCL